VRLCTPCRWNLEYDPLVEEANSFLEKANKVQTKKASFIGNVA